MCLEHPLSLTVKRDAETHYSTCMTPGKARAMREKTKRKGRRKRNDPDPEIAAQLDVRL